MRMTRHNGRADKNGVYNPKHNDRRFDLGNSEHIDPERSKLNIYWDTFYGYRTFDHMEPETELADTFEDVEQLYYEHYYRDLIEGQNARNEKTRHTERNRTAKQIRKNKKTCPEETLYQIGTMDNHVLPEVLMKVVAEFMDTLEKRFGSTSTSWTGRSISMKVRRTFMSATFSTVKINMESYVPSKKKPWRCWDLNCYAPTMAGFIIQS